MGADGPSTARVQRGPSEGRALRKHRGSTGRLSQSIRTRFFHSPGNGTRIGSTAPVERAHSDRARSGSKESMRVSFPRPKRPLKKLPRLPHVLLDIRLQMPGSCLPVAGGIADAAGEEDELVLSVRGSTKSFVLPRMNRSTD